MRVALTGHRPQRLKGKESEIYQWILEQLDKENYTEAYSGMAMGADQLFAVAAEEKNIPLICCYPYKKERFHPKEIRIMDNAEDVRFISQEYSKKAYWLRDKYMVDNCDVLLAVFDGKKYGGTWITIEYAERIGKPVVYFPFNDDSKENDND